MRWLAYCPKTLEQLYHMLFASIKYFQEVFNARQLTNYAAGYCEQSPFEAVSLLGDIIKTAKEAWWIPEEEVERSILCAAMQSNNANAKDIAIYLINLHGERGDYRWRDLLN